MPKSTLILGLLVAAAVCRAADHAHVDVLLRFDSRPSPEVVRELRTELNELFSTASVELDWSLLSESHGNHLADRSLIFHFRGACAVLPAREDVPFRVRLAEAAVDDSGVLPYSDIDCDLTRAFARPGFAPGAERLLGRALGRLMAHEMYHILLNTREHTSSGISRALQTPAMLLRRSLSFDSGELDRIRRILLPGK